MEKDPLNNMYKVEKAYIEQLKCKNNYTKIILIIDNLIFIEIFLDSIQQVMKPIYFLFLSYMITFQ